MLTSGARNYLENSTPSHNRSLLAFANERIMRLEQWQKRYLKGDERINKIANEVKELKNYKADLESAIAETFKQAMIVL